MGTLYVVATPIGNLEDLSPRAARVLANAGLVAAEDTRHTGLLLRHLSVRRPMVSLRAANEEAMIERLLERIAVEDVALCTDAGTPALSDPGRRLVDAALAAGLTVVPVPGPSALTAALACCGIAADDFTFVGFPPRRPGEMRRLLERLGQEGRAAVLFEAPGRLVRLLVAIAASMPGRQVAVCRELTKMHEEVRRAPAGELADHYSDHPPRGEVTIVVAPAEKSVAAVTGVRREALRAASDASVARMARRLKRAGVEVVWGEGAQRCFLVAPDGSRVELVAASPDPTPGG